jgi:hypothetical protein
MRIDASGSVGIGSTSLVNTLDVAGTGIHIGSGVPGSTLNQVYNSSGTLYWNGNPLLRRRRGCCYRQWRIGL